MQIDPTLALFAAPLHEVAGQVGDDVAVKLLDVLPEVIRRAQYGEYLNGEQATAATGLTERQLRHLRSTRQVEYVKRGRTVLYPTQALFAYLDAGRVEAKTTTAT